MRMILGTMILAAAGCQAGTAPPDGGGGGPGDESTDARCADGVDNDGDGWIDCEDPGCFALAACGAGDAGPPRDAGFVSCVGDPYDAMEAYVPVDIVWVVDTSGSMSDEAERVQQNMHSFATAIGMVGIDWHVVMISTQAFVDVPEPLASDPRYRLIDRPVSSSEPLRALLDEFSRYRDHLRANAVTHFVAVTDDESDLGWMSFRTSMVGNLGHTFIFHTISSEEVSGTLTGACEVEGGGFPPEGAAAPGIQYWELAAATGGRAFSICTPASEWAELFVSLTEAIAVPMVIPCEYAIPDPPAGAELDFGQVNVLYTPGDGGGAVRYPYVGTDDGVDCTIGGWYYDDPSAPTRIILCPSTCSMISGDTSGRVDVELGCETFII